MFFGCLGVLIASAGFITEIPETLERKLTSTNEVCGTFVQTKIDHERKYVTTGRYRIRPGVDFEWKTLEPFETTFYATKEEYVYSNEDESVRRKLKDMPNSDRFEAIGRGDYEQFFEAFDALYKEEDGRFFVKAKPKISDLKRVLERIDAEGTITNWTFEATFPNGVRLKLELRDE